MTLTASLPTKALTSILAALLLSAALAAAVPVRTELPGVLNALDVAVADAHTQQHCYYETMQVQNRHGTATGQTVQRQVCVDVAHSHPVRGLIAGIGAGLACGVLGAGLGPGGALAAGLAVWSAAACASADSSACESAAWSQADAEQRWALAYAAHEQAHEEGRDHGVEPETDVLGTRVAMILAEAETRRQCD